MATMAQNFTNEQQQIVSAAIKKIDLEAESVSGQQVPAIAIYNFIKEKCKEDVAFAEKVLIETKKLSKCFDHIMKIAYNRAEARHNLTKENRVGVGMSSEEIMDLVVDYYNLDDKAIAQKEAEEKAKAKANAYFNHDHTHTSMLGARNNAQSLAKGLRKNNSPLTQYLK